MANKQALREFQARLAQRLQQARDEPRGQSWLALQCAGIGLLVPLQQAGEIFEFSGVVPVPHAQPWLWGVVNLRGGLCTVVDLAGFLGLRPGTEPHPRERGRLVAFNGQLGVNAALLVDQLLGLRHAADMQPEPVQPGEPARPRFAPARWRDGEGAVWQALDLAELAVTPEFLAIGA